MVVGELLSRCGGGEPRAVKVVQVEGRLGRTKALRSKSCCTVLIIHDKKHCEYFDLFFTRNVQKVTYLLGLMCTRVASGRVAV